jgi:ketosteroid isomerase-like protein
VHAADHFTAKELHMTTVDRRSAFLLGTASVACLASPKTASAQAGEVARNKEVLARAYQRWHETKGGSVNDWMEIIAGNIQFGSIAEGMPAATFTARVNGKQELKRYFDGLRENWEMIHYTVNHFIAEGDRVAAVGSTAWRNKRTGKVCETPKVDVWRLRDGRAIEFYEYFDTAKMIQAAT